jgi:hypothetical protein
MFGHSPWRVPGRPLSGRWLPWGGGTLRLGAPGLRSGRSHLEKAELIGVGLRGLRRFRGERNHRWRQGLVAMG